jgi:hypothetical protein
LCRLIKAQNMLVEKIGAAIMLQTASALCFGLAIGNRKKEANKYRANDGTAVDMCRNKNFSSRWENPCQTTGRITSPRMAPMSIWPIIAVTVKPKR